MKPMEILHDDAHEYWTPDCSEPQLIFDPIEDTPNGWNTSMSCGGSKLIRVMKELKITVQYNIQLKDWKMTDVSPTVFYGTMVHGLVKGGFGLKLDYKGMDDDWIDHETLEEIQRFEEYQHYRVGVRKFILDHVCKHGNGKSLRQQQESMKSMLGFNMARKVTVTFYTADTVPGGRIGLTTSTVGKRVRTRSELAAER